jgi:hypothetical protein
VLKILLLIDGPQRIHNLKNENQKKKRGKKKRKYIYIDSCVGEYLPAFFFFSFLLIRSYLLVRLGDPLLSHQTRFGQGIRKVRKNKKKGKWGKEKE